MSKDASDKSDRAVVNEAPDGSSLQAASIPSAGPLWIEPSEEELRAGANANAAPVLPFNIDRWPDDVRDLSMPTKLIEVDADKFVSIFDYGTPEFFAEMNAMAELLDSEMGWDQYFIRLNTRSPKDAAHPAVPITCSGKQAMMWMAKSMRCLDDTVMMRLAREPLFIALREAMPINPAWEMRSFAKDGQVIAVSRYDYLNPPEDGLENFGAMEAARAFYENHLGQHYETVVFDLAFGAQSGGPLLIELNPYGMSDPCCFGSYENVEKIGGYAAKAIEARRAETGTGSVHESAVGTADLPTS